MLFFGNDYYGTGNIKLYKVDPGQGIRTPILTQTTSFTGNAMQKIVSMSYWKHPNGNEILYLQSTTDYGRFSSSIYALDITNDSIYDRVWNGGNKTVLRNHIIDGNTIYFNQVGLITKHNMLTKTEDWRQYTNAGLHGGNNMILDNGFLYIPNERDDLLYRIDTINGDRKKLIIYNVDLGNENTIGKHLFVQNNKLYYSTPNSFIVFDISSSKTTHILNKGNTLNGIPVETLHASFVIDPSNGNIYTGWKNNITCIKPN